MLWFALRLLCERDSPPLPGTARHSPLREEALSLASRTFEFSEFLVKVEAITQVGAQLPR